MWYIIMSLLGIIVVLIILSIMHSRIVELNIDMSNSLLIDDINSLAQQYHNAYKIGYAVSIKSSKHNFYRVMKIISSKIKRNISLSDGEKWIYDNADLLSHTYNQNVYSEFVLLPSLNKKIRLIELVIRILSRTNNMINIDEIDDIITKYIAITPLKQIEIMHLSNAFRYVFAIKLNEIFKIILKDHAMMKKGISAKHVSNKYMIFDAYAVGLMDNPHVKRDVNEQNLLRMKDRYLEHVKDMSTVISDLIGSMRQIDEVFTAKRLLNYSHIHRILLENNDYAQSSIDTQYLYINAVVGFSSKYNIKEDIVIKGALDLEKKYNIHFGIFLLNNNNTLRKHLKKKVIKEKDLVEKNYSGIYVASILIGSLLISALLSYLVIPNIYSLLIAFPMFLVVFKALETIFNRIIRFIIPKRAICKCNYSEINATNRTMVVVSEFVSDEEDICRIREHINSLYYANKQSNVEFAVLVDLAPSSEEWSHHDELLLDNLRNALHESVSIFVRNRVLQGNSYKVYERKRGAIMNLFDYLINDNASHFKYIRRKENKYVKYAILLDSDTEVLPDLYLDSVNTILHPMNRKYDLLTYVARYNLFSLNNLYSIQYLNSSGREEYGAYSDLMYDISSNGIYQGKGIIDIRRFYDKVNNKIMPNSVLSHDILEGSMTCVGMTNKCIYEDIPNNFVSNIARNSRWMRGDLLLLPYAKNTQKTSKISKTSINKPLIYKYIIYSNAILPFYRLSMLGFFMYSILISNWLLLTTFLIIYNIPTLIEWLNSLMIRGKNQRFSGLIYSLLVKSLECLTKSVFLIVLLPFYAVNDIANILDLAMLKISKKDIFKWRTFSNTQKSIRLVDFIRFSLKYSIISIFVMILSLIYNKLGLFYYFLSTNIMLYILYFIGKIDIKKHKIYKEKYFRDIACRTYKFFETINRDYDLIVDNFQLTPLKGKAAYTSPTNIGFSLVAEIAGYHLKLVDIDTTIYRINKMLSTISSLPKYKGNLYNWYNVDTHEPISPLFISSVDNGNLLACLIVTRQFLIDYSCDLTIIDSLINDMDLDLFYLADKGIFAIGYDVIQNELSGNYDLLASEARLFNYIACLKTGNFDAYHNLDRKTINVCGNTLLSWSGTMFEYYMPSLFINDPHFSLMEQTLKNVLKCQIKHGKYNIFGVSESGYAEYDVNFYYQYHAFGLNALSMRTEEDKAVISPYSAIISISNNPKACYTCLQALCDRGMLGEYGFYEALDRTRGDSIVYSYMSHHQGMALVSLTNYLCDNIFRRYFMESDLVRGGRLLLTDKCIENHYLVRRDKGAYKNNSSFNYYEEIDNNLIEPRVNILSNGYTGIYTDSIGQNYQYIDGILIDRFVFHDGYSHGGMFTVTIDGTTISPQINRFRDNIEDFRVFFTEKSSEYINKKYDISMNIEALDHSSVVKRTLKINNHGDETKTYKISYYDELMMCSIDEYISHPAFVNMFIDTLYDKSHDVILARRKSRESKDAYYSAMFVTGLSDIRYTTNVNKVVDRYEKYEDKRVISIDNDGIDFGDVLNACFYAEGTLELKPHTNASVSVYTFANKDRSKLYDEIMSMKREQDVAKSNSLTQYHYFDSDYDFRFASRLVSKLINTKGENRKNKLVVYDGKMEDITYKKLVKIRDYMSFVGIYFNLDIVKNKNSDITNKASILLKSLKLDEDTSIKRVGFKYITRKCDARSIPSIKTKGQSGGFNAKGEFIVTSRTDRPFSNVVALPHGGFIATENGVVYSYEGNSRENKNTLWSNDIIGDIPSEKLYLVKNNNVYRINVGHDRGYTLHGFGYTRYTNSIDNVDIDVTRSVIDEGDVQLYKIDFASQHEEKLRLIFELNIALGVNRTDNFKTIALDNRTIKVTNLDNDKNLFIRSFDEIDILDGIRDIGDKYSDVRTFGNSNDTLALSMDILMQGKQNKSIYIIFGQDIDALSRVNIRNIEEKYQNTLEYFSNISAFEVKSSDTLLDSFFNKWLPYQIKSSRINGRTAFYQAGGAVGFRDQLQDMLSMIYSEPHLVHDHILDAGRHQYLEGDVMHWWHEPRLGVRTRISDDRLFLPFVTMKYIEITGDENILNEKIPYLHSAPLEEREHSRYESPQETNETYSLKDHLMRAIDASLRFGEHDLSLIGSGDWNDALDRIGTRGRGESVWLSMMLYKVLTMTDRYFDGKYEPEIKRLNKAINESFEEDRYRRAFTDDGEWLGSKYNDTCNIDLLTQAFSVLSGASDVEQNMRALQSAEVLIDKENRLIKLFAPPFDWNRYYGYISAYPSGVRENGGQYTHASIWYIMALHKIGKVNDARELFKMICPIEKYTVRCTIERYKVEPYVMPADIYSAEGHEGEGGWTWYTGSASWTYLYMLNMLYGIEKQGEKLIINKTLNDSYGDYVIKYHHDADDYEISVQHNGVSSLTIDGVTIYGNEIELKHDRVAHHVLYTY